MKHLIKTHNFRKQVIRMFLPYSEDICNFQKCRIYQYREWILLKQFWISNNCLALFANLARSEPCKSMCM